MSIKYELKKHLQNKTRRLGTNADSYLTEFFSVIYENNSISTFEDFVAESKYAGKSKATIRQLEEVLIIFGLLEDEQIVYKDVSTKESFVRLLTENIKQTIKNKNQLLNGKYKNIDLLVNNFIYIHGINFIKKNHKDITPFFDETMRKRTSELQVSKHIDEDDVELQNIVLKQFEILLDECGYSLGSDRRLDSYVKNEITNIHLRDQQVNDTKGKIENNVNNIFDLVKIILNESQKIVIPFYQREYVWTPELIQNFIIDIASNEKEMLNIGSILISINGEGHERKYALVDGQQRLTSIMMIFNALSKALAKIDLSDVLEIGYRELINKCKTSTMIKNIENISNEKYIDDLEHVMNIKLSEINSLTRSASTIRKNYSVVANFINELSESSKINLFKKLGYILSVVTYDGASDEIELFISTNASRKPLTNYDLIRSYIISKVETGARKDVPSTIMNRLNKITELIKFESNGNETMEDTFFKFYLDYVDIINSSDHSKYKNLFERFRHLNDVRISSNKDIEILLDQLIHILESYRIAKAIDSLKDIYYNDFQLSLGSGLKVTSIYDIFMVFFVEILREREDKERVQLLNITRRILLVIEEFEIKWKLFTFRGDSLTNSLTNLFIKFYDGIEGCIERNEYEQIEEVFKNIIAEDGGFVSSVLNNEENNNIDAFLSSDNIEQQKNALKILNRVCFNLWNNNSIEYKQNSTVYYEHSKPTVEHIYPRSHSKWDEDNRTNSNELLPFLESIGNKFIYNGSENSSAGNKTFENKLIVYKKYNNIQIDKTLSFKYNNTTFDFLSKKTWNQDDVKLRERYIIDSLLDIWNK